LPKISSGATFLQFYHSSETINKRETKTFIKRINDTSETDLSSIQGKPHNKLCILFVEQSVASNIKVNYERHVGSYGRYHQRSQLHNQPLHNKYDIKHEPGLSNKTALSEAVLSQTAFYRDFLKLAPPLVSPDATYKSIHFKEAASKRIAINGLNNEIRRRMLCFSQEHRLFTT
jgi:hypothetical protein